LPIADEERDGALIFLVLHHAAEPPLVLAEAARSLRPGGQLLVIVMMPHDREEYRHSMGHVWLGIPETQLGDWLRDAGYSSPRVRTLAPDPAARGPVLFAASAVRNTDSGGKLPGSRQP